MGQDTPATIEQPAWDVATLFPNQGLWSEEDYLLLPTNHLVEFSEGVVEVLPMPTEQHQFIVSELYDSLKSFVKQNDLGYVLFAPLRVRLWEGKIREPDVVFLSNEHRHLRGRQYWSGVDLAVEVVSDDDPDRDLTRKRAEYARAGIAEYWIVDPRDRSITVLTLPPGGTEYREAGRYAAGETAESVLLDGFRVNVTDAFTAE